MLLVASTHLDNVSLEFPAHFLYGHLVFRLKDRRHRIISILCLRYV